MKFLALVLSIVTSFALSTAACAQSADSRPLTRAEVRQQLVAVDHAGYNPAISDGADYPAEIQAAERRLREEGTKTSVSQYSGALPLSSSTASR